MILKPYEYGFRDDVESGLCFHQGETRRNLCVYRKNLADSKEHQYFEPAVHGGELPTHVRSIAHQYSLNGTGHMLEISKLKWLRTVNGDIRYRIEDIEKRNGVDCKSHTYHVFLHPYGGRDNVVIAVSHGGGIFFHTIYGFDFDQTMQVLCNLLTNTQLYNVLHNIVSAYDHGKEHGRSETAQRYSKAFYEKRLKVRKRRGEVRIEIVDPPTPEDGAFTVKV